jgi:hypothetical protein
MNDSIDLMLLERFSTQHEPLPGPNFKDVRDRTGHLATKKAGLRLLRPRNNRRLLLSVGILLAFAGGTAALARTLLIGDSSRPIVAQNVSALQQLPPIPDPPSTLLDGIRSSTSRLGGNVAVALRSVRQVGSDVGQAETNLYAYDIGPLANSGGRDVLCLIVWNRGGACQTATDSLFPDVLLVVSSGGPGYQGLPDSASPTIAGLVADDVTDVSLIENERTTSLRILNNAFFTELSDASDTRFTVTLRFTYSDGSKKQWNYHQDAPARVGP